MMALLATSCTQKQTEKSYSIKGTVPAGIEAKQMYLYIPQGNELVAIDSTAITNNSFQFKGETPDSTMIAILHPGSMNEYPAVGWNVIIEPGAIVVDSTEQFATGTPLNDGFKDWMSELYKILYTSMDPNDVHNFFVEHWAEHSTDFVGAFVLSNMAPYLEFPFVDSLAADVPEELRNNGLLKDFFNQLDTMRKMQPGQLFTDAEMQDLDGNAVKLSDYIGKGDYVLLDFWASWCGPCRQAMPQLQSTVTKYKKLKVYGIAVSDEMDDTRRAINDLKITWPVLYDKPGNSPRAYGINAIPAMILFAPDGTIAARDFNVNELEQILNEKMKK